VSEHAEAKAAELEELRRRSAAQIASLRRALREEVRSGSRLDEDPNGSDIHEKERALALLANLEAKHRALGRAISMVERGTYGRCERCGEPIPEERLRILPETTMCVRCTLELEGSPRTTRRG
jgi:RNA polymerase-binding transcription factor DksA